MVLNAFTTLALAGAALATSSAIEVSSPRASPSAAALKGLLMSTMTLPARAAPYWATTGATLAYNRATMTMSPAGTAPQSPVVALPPSALARSAALDGSRPRISTVLPPATASAPMVRAVFPVPMMLMLLMRCPVLTDDAQVDWSPL